MTVEAAPDLVLDSSVTLVWSLSDELSDYADGVFDALRTRRAIAPPIWALEVANGLLMAERRSRSMQAETSEIVAVLRSLPIGLDGETSERALGDVLALARQQGLTAYDAAYLELAMRRGLPLASVDDRLRAAADAVGVRVFAP